LSLLNEGDAEGLANGLEDGDFVGETDGVFDGEGEGLAEGFELGRTDGLGDGFAVGSSVKGIECDANSRFSFKYRRNSSSSTISSITGTSSLLLFSLSKRGEGNTSSLFLVNLFCSFLDVAASVESATYEEAARVKIAAPVDILILLLSDYSSKRVSSFFYVYFYVFRQVFSREIDTIVKRKVLLLHLYLY
jgi:hypothetical protein